MSPESFDEDILDLRNAADYLRVVAKRSYDYQASATFHAERLERLRSALIVRQQGVAVTKAVTGEESSET